MIIAALLATGLSVGIISTFFGVGGGVIAVPMLYLIFPKITPQIAISSSMGMIFINSIINVFNFTRLGQRPKFNLLINMGVGIITGVILGVNLTAYIDDIHLKLFFSLVLLLVSVKLAFFKGPAASNEAQWSPQVGLKNRGIEFLVAMCGGILAGLTGLGGGAIMVPLFISILRMPLKWIPVYSNFLMGCGALVGITNYMVLFENPSHLFNSLIDQFHIGMVNWGIVLMLSVGSLISSRAGVRLFQKTRPELAQKLFAALLFVIAIIIFFKSYSLLS